MSNSSGKVGIVSLGCPKALVDSEHIVSKLRAEGYEISPDYEDADLIIINTCGFIDAAIEESLQSIEEALEENGKVIVTGCLGAKGSLVEDTFPELLAITGPHAAQEVMDAVHQHLPPRHDPFLDLIPAQGIKLTPKHYAYLKISEGCNHSCSFCIIPQLRGKLESRPINQVLSEAENLVNAGVKELLVISQDTSAYGLDLKYRNEFWKGRVYRSHIKDLSNALGQFGIWIRLHYVYPYPHVDDLIPLMASGHILPYLDIPFQHGSPSVLKRMKRPAHSENVLRRIKLWREICPDIAIRSTFIVGFPGETEAEFQELLAFVEQAQLDKVGCFTYSAVDGAPANAIANAVEEEVKLERQERLMLLQAGISAAKLQNKINKNIAVIIDEKTETYCVGRSTADAPDIDGSVQILGDISTLKVGDIVSCKVIDADEHDLVAEYGDN